MLFVLNSQLHDHEVKKKGEEKSIIFVVVRGID